MGLRRRLDFVYSPEHRDAGSTVMRGGQLAEIVRAEAPRSWRISYSKLSGGFRDSTLILTKGALKVLDSDQLEELRRRGNRLIFDVVDEVPPATTSEFADVLIASSIEAFVAYSREFSSTRVCLVNHHVDPRIDTALAGRIGGPVNQAKIAYFGEPINAVLTPEIRTRVEIVTVDTSRQDTEWMGMLGSFNVHYAVRRTRDLDRFKPFLKGFTAAHVGANILIQDSQTEALHWLGNDYPYLLKGDVEEAAILNALALVEESFGSKQWFQALDRMREVKSRLEPRRIARELLSAVG